MHIDKFRQSNGEYIDEEGITWSDAESFIHCKMLGFCGCGSNRDNLQYIKECIEAIESYRNGDREDTPHEQFVWYVLDQKGFLEHGTAIPGWLTQKGQELLDDLRELLKEVRG